MCQREHMGRMETLSLLHAAFWGFSPEVYKGCFKNLWKFRTYRGDNLNHYSFQKKQVLIASIKQPLYSWKVSPFLIYSNLITHQGSNLTCMKITNYLWLWLTNYHNSHHNLNYFFNSKELFHETKNYKGTTNYKWCKVLKI